MSIDAQFTKFSATRLEQLMGRIETCVAKLTPEQVWARHSDNENAVGNLLLHLSGNVRQWILSGVGGAPDSRVRDAEFSARQGAPPQELVQRLRSTVGEAAALIRRLTEEALMERVTIQGYEVIKMEAIYTVVEHFAGHAYQIMFATKLLTGSDLGFYAHLNRGASAAARTDKTP